MKEEVLAKLNEVRELAKGSTTNNVHQGGRTSHSEDGLSRAIRNEKDANIFMAELNGIIKASSQR